MKLAFSILLTPFLLLPLISQATLISYQIDEQGRVVPQQAEVNSGRVVVKGAGGDATQDLWFDAARNVMLIINHTDRSYMQIDEKVIDEVAALVDTLSGAVESQQGVLADLLGTLGLNTESTPPPAPLRPTGKQLTISGFSCQLFQSHVESNLESEICIAGNETLKMDNNDYLTLRKFLKFGNTLLNRAGKLLDALGLNLPTMNFASTRGLPIGMHSAPRSLKVRITTIKPGGAAGSYQLPAGYTRSAIPFTSG